DHRELSLLLQYGLPPEQSQFDHPEKITPPFRDRKSQNYRRVLEWINSLSGPLHPDYRTTYKPPFKLKTGSGGLPLLPPATTKPAEEGFFD
ncbi:MAG: hypothetical protein SVT52_03305, partial [Planctomycetota bacterium]|nr:hypothetical protein [Planctomycetota bacterium]